MHSLITRATSTFVLIAHRGESSLAPENTMASFNTAIEHGFPHMEFDVQLTKDGICCVLHDEVLGRTVPGQGPVADVEWSVLSSLDAGSWFVVRAVQSSKAQTQDHLLIPSAQASGDDATGTGRPPGTCDKQESSSMGTVAQSHTCAANSLGSAQGHASMHTAPSCDRVTAASCSICTAASVVQPEQQRQQWSDCRVPSFAEVLDAFQGRAHLHVVRH